MDASRFLDDYLLSVQVVQCLQFKDFLVWYRDSNRGGRSLHTLEEWRSASKNENRKDQQKELPHANSSFASSITLSISAYVSSLSSSVCNTDVRNETIF